jgi:hypothetical protein
VARRVGRDRLCGRPGAVWRMRRRRRLVTAEEGWTMMVGAAFLVAAAAYVTLQVIW